MPNPKDPVKLAEYKRKMSEIAKAKGYGKWMKGKKASPKALEKMSVSQKEIGNRPEERQRRSERAKRLGVGKWMAGKVRPPEVSEKTAVHKRGKTYEEIYGERADEEKEKRRTGNKRRFIGMVLKCEERPYHGSNSEYERWRKAVFARDDYTCQKCKARGGALEAHHIKPWAKFVELRYEVSNGLTVCKGKCHREADRESRELYG